MYFTSPIEIARQGSKIFTNHDESVVLSNNKPIGLLLGGKLAEAVLDSGLITQINEELWELNDKKTVSSIRNYKKGDRSNMITLSDYKNKYDLGGCAKIQKSI